MLVSYNIIKGKAIKDKVKISGVGVMIPEAIKINNIAWRLYFFNKFAFTIFNFARKNRTSGSSNAAPNPKSRIKTKDKYSLIVIIGVDQEAPNSIKNLTAAGTAKKKPKPAPIINKIKEAGAKI